MLIDACPHFGVPTMRAHARRQVLQRVSPDSSRETAGSSRHDHIVETQAANAGVVPSLEVALTHRRISDGNAPKPAAGFLECIEYSIGLGAVGAGLNQHAPAGADAVQHAPVQGGRC